MTTQSLALLMFSIAILSTLCALILFALNREMADSNRDLKKWLEYETKMREKDAEAIDEQARRLHDAQETIKGMRLYVQGETAYRAYQKLKARGMKQERGARIKALKNAPHSSFG